jgi:hypothetical protein
MEMPTLCAQLLARQRPAESAFIFTHQGQTTSNRRAVTAAPISSTQLTHTWYARDPLHFGFRIFQSFALESAYALSYVKCDEIGYVFGGLERGCTQPRYRVAVRPTLRHIFPSIGQLGIRMNNLLMFVDHKMELGSGPARVLI